MIEQQILLVIETGRRARSIVSALNKNSLGCKRHTFLSSVRHALAEKRYNALIIHERIVKGELEGLCSLIRADDPALVIVAILIREKSVLEERLLDLGVDDVATPSTAASIIAKRTTIRLSKRCQVNHVDRTVRLGKAIIDFDRLEVWNHGKIHTISIGLANLLRCFLDNCGGIVSRQEATEMLWTGAVIDPAGKNLDVHVSKLRRLVEPDPKHPIFIKTVRGIGYKLVRCSRVVSDKCFS